MMNNYASFNQGVQPNGGYGYANNKNIVIHNPMLKNADAAKLKELASGAFDTKINSLEFVQAQCTHKNMDGSLATVQNMDGSHTCTLCQEVFNLVGPTAEEVKVATKNILDILQSAKAYYLDMPQPVAEFLKMIPMIKKIPQLYDVSINSLAKADNGLQYQQQGQFGGMNMMNAITSGMGMYNPMMAGGMNMMPNQMMGNPMGGQQMMGNMPMNGSNGFGFGGGVDPMQQQMMQQQMMQQQMMQQQMMQQQNGMNQVNMPNQGVQPQQAAQGNTVEVQKVMNV